jgi:7,8-dihydropterin-6-yl-methyl-4-(beta-D-ribofuranosyl)aminobenzene 5'-phosphate synthase
MTSRYSVPIAVLMIIGLVSACVGACSVYAAVHRAGATPAPLMSFSPTAAPERTEGPTTSVEEPGSMTVSVVYDNNGYDPHLRTGWGFSCLVELEEITLLFDTGGDGGILLHNMSALGLDPLELDSVVLSHIHRDHTGGLESVLATGVRPIVYMPRSFPADLKDQVRSRTDVREVRDPTTITEGIHSTGELGSGIIEQSLVLDTDEGLVIITGCAHPGIVNIVHRVQELYGNEIYLVMGGFHLRDKSTRELENIIAQLRQLGVQKVAPSHCTGEQATDMLAEEWSEDFITNGVGRVIEVEQRAP